MLAKKPKGATERRKSSGSSGLLWMFIGAILTLMIGLFLYLWNPFDMGTEQAEEEHVVQPITNSENQGNNDYEFYDLLPEQEITSIPDEAIITQEAGDGSDLESDVVVTTPTPQQRADEGDANNYGVAEGNPIQTQKPRSANGEQEIVIVEEEGTYDGGHTNNRGSNNTSADSSTSSASIQAASPQKTYILQINSFTTAQDADKRRAQVLMAGVNANVVKKTQNGQVYYQVVSTPMTNRQQVAAALQKLQNNGIDALIVEQRH